ncbi:uncharacterized protein LOC134469895 [Engraulis encrasicolus]|uniref:uncharacterized protein LOC134469895 n=1 Tax=Engraulis encrasicolus TaxID=184585 RepID=UPI002FD61CB3
MPETLNELKRLQRSQFGQPEPRHGLRLLFWFANELIEFISNQMFATVHPNTAVFGFHPFHNRPDHDGDILLPETENSDYYVVGNLKNTNAYQFPDYVTEKYTGLQDDSNTDRIIVDMDGCNVYRVYVTRHLGRSNFSHSETYRISQGLISVIKKMEDLEDFLSKIDPSYRLHSLEMDLPRLPPVNHMCQPKHCTASLSGNRDTSIQPSLTQSGNMYQPKESPVSQSGDRDPPKDSFLAH